jgi:hypothetical protein
MTFHRTKVTPSVTVLPLATQVSAIAVVSLIPPKNQLLSDFLHQDSS